MSGTRENWYCRFVVPIAVCAFALAACAHSHDGEFFGDDGMWHKKESSHPLPVPPRCGSVVRHVELRGHWTTLESQRGLAIGELPEDVDVLSRAFGEPRRPISNGMFIVPTTIDSGRPTVELVIPLSPTGSLCEPSSREPSRVKIELPPDGEFGFRIDCSTDAPGGCSVKAT